MEVEEEETLKNPTSTPEPSTTPVLVEDETLISTTNLQPPISVVPTPLPQAPLPQTLIPTLPIVPPIAPIPRALAPIPIRPPIRPQNGEANGSDSDSDGDNSGGPNRSTPLATAAEYEISEESKQIRERQEKAMQELLMKRRAYALAVPTNDSAVRARLRRLGEPVTLFGEREMERRDRLRMIMVKLDAEGQLDKLLKAHEDEEAAVVASMVEDEGEGPQTYPFYTEGSKVLLEARVDIAKYSIVRAGLRLERAKRRRDDPDEDLDAEMDWALRQASGFVLDCSEIGDDRPLTGCSFSHDGKLLATW